MKKVVDISQSAHRAKPPGKLKLILIVGISLLIIFAGGAFATYYYIHSNLAAVSSDFSSEQVIVTVPKGASTREIGDILAQVHLIKNARFFALYSRYKKVDNSFRSGEFVLSPTMTMDELMEQLSHGQPPITVKVTIPEGYNTKQIADLLAAKNLINREKFMDLIKNHKFAYDFLPQLPSSESPLEGFLFPATYDIPQGSSEEQIIDMLLKRFEQELTPQIRQAVKAKSWSYLQFVTMASLIEKEAKEPEDRPVISQVFQTRLKIGMPLQSCASIQYLLGEPKPVLLLKDLEIKSPYNTYLNKGLPPGPIANPGSASLQAAAFPAKTDYLYFVAKSDGYHAFAKTYQEHLQNQKKYLGE